MSRKLENIDTSLIVMLENGKYAFSGGVLEEGNDAEKKAQYGMICILPLREEEQGKYKRGEEVPDDAVVPDAPPFRFAFQDQEQVDFMIRYLVMVRSYMEAAGIPYSKNEGGRKMLNFGQAIERVKQGERMKRMGWNGKNQYIEIAKNISYVNAQGEIVNAEHEAIGNRAIAFVGTSGVQLGWLASQADMLAGDWMEYTGPVEYTEAE